MNCQIRITPRENQIIQLIAHEYTRTDISQELYISENTVATHRKNILAKLKVKNTAGMIRRSFELGILELQVTGVGVM